MIAFAILMASVSALGEFCNHAIERLRKGPEQYSDIIAAGQKYEDESFNGR